MEKKNNPMREIKIEKIVIGVGGVAEELEKGVKLLKLITERKPTKIRSKKRIPAFNVRPGLEVGAIVTIRKNKEEVLKRMLSAVDGQLSKKIVAENHFSFGIKEYLEVPGLDYQRDIGIIGFDVTIVFKRNGKRISKKKIKYGKIPKKQRVSKEEIIKFMEDKFNVKFI